jgi:acylphosphatase
MITRILRISGRVQGVGFRYALSDEARRLGLAGWVRNRADGSVEALVQGEAQAVEALLAWARVGPPAARVAQVVSRAPDPHEDQPHTGFTPRPTA